MSHQPMGVSGIDLDIVTGLPRHRRTREELEAQDGLKEMQALQRATKLSQELPEVVTVMARLLEQKAIELMKENEFCQGIIQQAKAYNITLDLPRLVASKIRRQSFGVVLNAMTDETQVAREDTDQEQ